VMLTPGQAVTISPLGSLGPTEPVTRMEREQGPHRIGMIAPAPMIRSRPDGDGDGDDRQGGQMPGERPRPDGDLAGAPPAGPAGPEHPGAPMARGGFGWLTQNRAAVRLESMREQMRHPEFVGRDADHDGKVLDNSAGPERPFPDGRPRGEEPPCLPTQPTAGTQKPDADDCAAPPPPSGGQPR
ncbi:MAG TPA: hypothetical protein V6D47_19765, partial [Oscillatoriaceae cyanobacterium]